MTTHGRTGTYEYGVWVTMRQRCYNVNHHTYRRCGALGITVCRRWRDDFSAFFADMGEAPPNTKLFRSSILKNFTPSNCRWLTQQEGLNNIHALTAGGLSLSKKGWARRFGITPSRLRRLLTVHTLEALFKEPALLQDSPHPSWCLHLYKGEYRRAMEWATYFACSHETMRLWCREYGPEEAIRRAELRQEYVQVFGIQTGINGCANTPNDWLDRLMAYKKSQANK